MDYLFLAVAILCEVGATSALKAAHGFSQLTPSVLVIVGYAAAFYSLSLAIRTIPLGVAYAIWSGAGTALLALVGVLVYRQTLNAATMAGICFILLGVVVLNIFSGASGH